MRLAATVNRGIISMQASDAGDHQVLHGADGGDGEGVDLAGNPHGTQLGADAGAAPGGQHDAGQQGTQYRGKK